MNAIPQKPMKGILLNFGDRCISFIGSTGVKGINKGLFTIAIECLLSDFIVFFVNEALITA